MINGDVNEFIEGLLHSYELVFMYKGEKYFIQGFLEEDGKYVTYVDRWDPPSDDYIWVGKGETREIRLEKFLNAKIWDEKTFWEVEQEMEWVDC